MVVDLSLNFGPSSVDASTGESVVDWFPIVTEHYVEVGVRDGKVVWVGRHSGQAGDVSRVRRMSGKEGSCLVVASLDVTCVRHAEPGQTSTGRLNPDISGRTWTRMKLRLGLKDREVELPAMILDFPCAGRNGVKEPPTDIGFTVKLV